MGKGEKPRERLTSEERRARIIDAALDLFSQRGFSGARTKEIALQAGISETLIFQHFKSKEDLYHSSLRHLFGSYRVAFARMKELMAKEDDVGVFTVLAANLVKDNRRDPRILRLALFNALEMGHFHDDIDGVVEEEPPMRELLRKYIEQRADEGVFRRVNPELATRWFIDTVYMYILDQGASISGPPLEYSDDEVIETFVAIFLNGIRKTPR